MKTFLTAWLGVFLFLASVHGAELLLEAESFSHTGGWVVDTQCIDAMKPGGAGSVLLLAHGMGTPCEDARTLVTFPEAGTYHVFVRTRNWASPWIPKGLSEAEMATDWSPGKFQIRVAEQLLPTIHGIHGADWAWHEGGTVTISPQKRTVEVAIHDLTGFEGRVDSLFFTTSNTCRLPDAPEPLRAERRKLLGLTQAPQNAGEYDLVVVGGGLAGCSAAMTAAQHGLRVALVQNRPVLGGNGSAEVGVPFEGKTNLPPYPELGNVTQQLGQATRHFGSSDRNQKMEQDDAERLKLVQSQKGLELFLNTHVVEVEKKENRIVAVVGENVRTGVRTRFPAAFFADCTGDGTVGFLAGADYRQGREARREFDESLAPEEADSLQLGASIQWHSSDTGKAQDFPSRLPWAISFTSETAHRLLSSVWYWECGHRFDQINEVERIRDQAFRSIYGNWSFLKNEAGENGRKMRNRQLRWVAFVLGKRESRRLMGDFILTQKDLIETIVQPDGCVPTSWHIDMHHPVDALSRPNSKHPLTANGTPEEAFLGFLRQGTEIPSYPIPYRCFYSRNISNLFMAGRNISASHVGFSTIRVMRTCSMMGEVVGLAATICVRKSTTPKGVYLDHFDSLRKLLCP